MTPLTDALITFNRIAAQLENIALDERHIPTSVYQSAMLLAAADIRALTGARGVVPETIPIRDRRQRPLRLVRECVS